MLHLCYQSRIDEGMARDRSRHNHGTIPNDVQALGATISKPDRNKQG